VTIQLSGKRWIATLLSVSLHLLFLIVLAVTTWNANILGPRVTISGFSETAGETVVALPTQASDDTVESQFQGIGVDLNTTVEVSSLELPQVLSNDGVFASATTPTSEILQSFGQTSRVGADGFVPLSIDARKTARRGIDGAKHGATQQSEEAVDRALAFLARNQLNNGSWRLSLPECTDCTDIPGALDDHPIASTGLSLLCFLGAGHTLTEGEYSETVRKGVYFLIQSLRYRPMRDVSFMEEGFWLADTSPLVMYDHGIATLALTEALQMSQDETLRKACQAAINYIISAQYKKDGGWGYVPRELGDLSIVGWQILSLKSGSAAKLTVPPYVLQDADRFVQGKAISKGHLFFYRDDEGRKKEPVGSMTAIGNLIRLFRGLSPTDSRIYKANEWIAKMGPSRADAYYNYYATQFQFHVGGPRWEAWNKEMRDYLVKTQVIEGPMAGSWYFDGIPFNQKGGRLYTTTLSCLTLEVYYRFLPVYAKSTDEFRL
jgi:hypothetical protein